MRRLDDEAVHVCDVCGTHAECSIKEQCAWEGGDLSRCPRCRTGDLSAQKAKLSTTAAPGNTLGGMTEPNAPETQDPQTPEPEEDDEDQDEAWTPSPETRMAAAHIAQLATSSTLDDPAEAGRLLRTAAELLNPQPTLLQHIAGAIADVGPALLPVLQSFLEQYTRSAAQSAAGGPPFVCGCMEPRRPLRPGMTVTGGIYPDPVPTHVEPWPPVIRMDGQVIARGFAQGRGTKLETDPDVAARREHYTGLNDAQYQRFKSRLQGHFAPDDILLIAGLMYGIGEIAEESGLPGPDPVG